MQALALLTAGLAQAQTVPDAGALLQQSERSRVPAPPKAGPALQVAPAPLRALSGATVTVSAFRFQGNTLLSSKELATVVAPFLNRPLDFAQLQDAAVAVAAAYRKNGWIVRAYLPHQEIENGVVTIQVIEAVFGAVRFEGAPPGRVPAERLRPIVQAAQPSGQYLNADALDRALLLLQDVPGVSVSGSLAPGEQVSETDLLLKVEDAALFSGVVGLDNTGSRSTGSARATADLFLNSAAHLGDQVAASLIHTEGSDYGRLAATLPVGAGGWRAGANASYLKYRLVEDDLAALQAHGKSSTLGLEATYPLLRARLRNLYAGFNYDSKRFDNLAAGASVTNYRIDAFSASLYGNALDTLGGGGSNNFNLTLVHGNVDLDGSPNRAADALTTRAAGAFTKLRYAASRMQVLSETFSAYAAVSGQAAGKNLDSAEKFYLGGAYGVRAYPANEGGGSSGQLVTAELRARLPHGTALSGFYDWGHVTVNHDNAFAGAALRNSYVLKGAGLTAGWQGENGVSVKATWARRIGDNPNATATGHDQDGTLIKNRIWLQASLPF